MAKKRVKRIGFLNVIGQILFVSLILPVIRASSSKRIDEIRKEFELPDRWGDAEIFHVPSVNSEETREVLRSLSPAVVVVNGTRIIGLDTLSSVTVPFINMHAGITPLYRGVHGGYWALTENRPDLVGTTIHLVDKGIDTGTILDQRFFSITQDDNFVTYPYLHTAHGISGLLSSIERVISGDAKPRETSVTLPSKLRSHPTIWGYLYNRVLKKVK